jgi:hypothetical protein
MMKRVQPVVKPARRLLRRTTVNHMLDTSTTTLKELERRGKLTPIRLGKRTISYPAEQVEALARGET